MTGFWQDEMEEMQDCRVRMWARRRWALRDGSGWGVWRGFVEEDAERTSMPVGMDSKFSIP
jgi:hypothetical protein